jgi:hypothetical protein
MAFHKIHEPSLATVGECGTTPHHLLLKASFGAPALGGWCALTDALSPLSDVSTGGFRAVPDIVIEKPVKGK